MINMGRRKLVAGTAGLVAAGALARPYIANAAGKSATLWAIQGFVQEEDAAFRKTVADYEKQSGNKIDYSIMPFQALNQKAISALTSGEVPDLIFHDAPATILPQNAWNDKLEDMSDVVMRLMFVTQRDLRSWHPVFTTASPRSAPTTWCRLSRRWRRSGASPGATWSGRPASI